MHISADVCASSATNPCRNGATCITSADEDVGYTCQCRSGCSGKNCDVCVCQSGGSFGCLNSATCLADGTCSCPAGYTGAQCQTCKLYFIFKNKFLTRWIFGN